MELTKWDVSFTTAMVLAVFIMSVAMPYVGLAAGDRGQASDIPVPDIDEWDLGPGEYERPDRPLKSGESRATVYEGGLTDLVIWTSNSSAIQPDESLTLSLEIYGYSNLTESVLVLENSTNLTQESVSFYGNETGVTKTANIDGDYIIDVTLEEYEDDAKDGKDRYQLRTKIIEVAGRSAGGGFIPWASGVAFDVGRVLGFIGEILVWATQASIGLVANLLKTGAAFATWMVDVTLWLADGYYTLVNGSDGWVLGLLTIPLIGLGYEAIKFSVIIVEVLPTT